MIEKPKPQELYRHFKGRLYQVITLARLESSGEEMVVYQALYGDYSVYCRPLKEFLSPVDGGKPRFTRLQGPKEADLPQNPNTPRSFEVPSQRSDPPKKGPTGIMAKTIEEEAHDLGLDPMVVAFLDADSAGTRLQILEGLRGKATDDMIDIMAMAAGVDVPAGDPWDRFGDLRDSLRTIEKFETNRLR